MKPLVSILIPAFNAERWISATLQSALAQTWPRKEVIVVDDGSTDRTPAIAHQFDSTDVRVVSQENKGAAAARNTAFSLSRGDYIQWLDADDLLSPDKIARQMQIAEHCSSKRTVCTCAWGTFIHRHYRARFVPTELWRDLSPVDFLLYKMRQYHFMQTATWLISRELAELAGPWNSSLVVDDDGEYFCRVLTHSDRIRFVPEAKVYYRASGVTGVSYIGRSNAKLDAQWRSLQLNIKDLRSLEDSARVREACVAFLQAWLEYFYPERPDIVDQAKRLAATLGGQLETPQLSWKYSWIQRAFGWHTAKRVRAFLPIARWSLQRLCDKSAFYLDEQVLRLPRHRVRAAPPD